MKHAFYISLMMILFVIITGMIYLSILVVLVRNGIIPLRNVVEVTDILMSANMYLGVVTLGALAGYFFGQKWWKIIYIDGVYYFDTSKKRDSRRRTIKKAPLEAK